MIKLSDRQLPHDTAQVTLPSNSLFMLGPATNTRFIHPVLPASGEWDGVPDIREEGARPPDGDCISLTFRAVHIFPDRNTGCLFGQAAAASYGAPLLVALVASSTYGCLQLW